MHLVCANPYIPGDDLSLACTTPPSPASRPLVTKNLREVGLLEKEHTRSSNLSGGQKRKLSVALALTGSPTLCILDEPTSGEHPARCHTS